MRNYNAIVLLEIVAQSSSDVFQSKNFAFDLHVDM